MIKKVNRRQFLGQASCAGLGYLTLKNSLINLKALSSSAISNSSVYDNLNDYKAIVCILLAGGNDSFNMLIPTDSGRYNQYNSARSHLALPLSSLNATLLKYNNVNINYAAHPSMTGVKDLFNSKRLSFLTNIGTLTHPNTTKSEVDTGNSPLGLFSHSDQIEQWQTGLPRERGAKGWAGRMADLISDCNSNKNISMNISLAGSNIFQNGDATVEYAVDPYYGAVGIDGYNPETVYLTEQIRTQAVDSLLGQTYQDIFEKTFVNVIRNARDGYVQFDAAMQNALTFANGAFPDSYLGASLEMIARTISVRDVLGFKRQVFFIVVGGWDHHDGLLANQQAMLGMVSDALFSFQESLKAQFGPSNQYIGVNVENKVLTMMISEFGRTLRPNQDGTDHAWGGNTLVMGGQNLIDGGKVFGSFPSMVLGNQNPLELDSSGRFIPTLSTDEYFGEIAQWFGVPSTDMSVIFPNIGNFYNPLTNSHPIGFIK